MKTETSGITSSQRRALAASGTVALTIALASWCPGCRREPMEEEREKSIKRTSRLSVERGEVVVAVDTATLARTGVATALVETARRREEVRGFGVVADPAGLAELAAKHAAVAAEARQAQARLASSRAEYERAKLLYEDDRNASAKTFQAAEASFRSDEAAVEAATVGVHAVAATAQQQWGPRVGNWLEEGSPALDRILARSDVLVQVTLDAGAALPQPPATAFLETSDRHRIGARFVSAGVRTDPRIQGATLFYLAQAGKGLLPGMNLAAYLPAGDEIAGAAVPESAVVWSEGRAWVFVHIEPDAKKESASLSRFARREVTTDRPLPDGGYLVTTLKPGTRVVVRGAQALLSEESRAQIRVGEE